MANTNTGSGGGGFLGNLGKIYLGYTGGFIVFTLILAVLEQMGVSNAIIGYCFVILTIGVYAYIGILSRTMDLSEYYVAGRKVPALYNGMATGADWMSAASFISMAGGLYLGGFNAMGYVLGWTGGYVLVGILLAPSASASASSPRASSASASRWRSSSACSASWCARCWAACGR